jgi:hypothetical protein
MKSLWIAALMTASFAASTFAWASDHAAKQAELDARCEQARQEKLAPERAAAIEECVEKKQKEDRAACERFYRDYGERSGRRPALFYWLPACDEAHAFREGDDQDT